MDGERVVIRYKKKDAGVIRYWMPGVKKRKKAKIIRRRVKGVADEGKLFFAFK